jgi:hypothetical protein
MDDRAEDESDNEGWTAEDLHDFLGRLVEELAQARQHPNDRDRRWEAMRTVELFSAIKLPSGLGHLIDILLIKPKAAAIILKRAMEKANRNTPAEGRDAAAARELIEILRDRLVPLSEALSGQLRD